MSKAGLGVMKYIIAAGLAVGSGLMVNRLREINELLGTSLMEESEELFREQEVAELKKEYVKSNSLTFWQFRLSIEITALQERLTVYTNRLWYFSDYQRKSNSLLREVVDPILSRYQADQVFENRKLIKMLQNNDNFNNQVTSLIMSACQSNVKLREEKKGYIQDMIDLQDKLMTLKVLGLTSEQRQNIDLVYDYLSAKDKALYSMVEKNMDENAQQPVQVNSDDYLSKIQQI